jgi:hypothetical protein
MLTRVLRTVRLDTIDKRSQVGCALRKLKDELTAQLGGADQVTPGLAFLSRHGLPIPEAGRGGLEAPPQSLRVHRRALRRLANRVPFRISDGLV